MKAHDERCKEEEVPGAEAFRIVDCSINNDIYSLAYVSLIDCSQLDKSVKNCAPVIQMNKREISNIYLGALLVICFQLTLIFLIISHMLSDKFKRVKPDSVLIILPRFLSSLMMHINVETDIRAGINLMKFAVNHPTKFKTAKKFDYRDDPTAI